MGILTGVLKMMMIKVVSSAIVTKESLAMKSLSDSACLLAGNPMASWRGWGHYTQD